MINPTTVSAAPIAATLCLLAASAQAADYPQWRGPDRDGHSRDTNLLDSWPRSGPPLLWQANDVGYGFSTPAVAEGRLYLLSNEGVADEFVKALDAADGSLVWSTRIGAVGKPDQNPNYPAARSTPTVDGDRLYALGSDGDLVCLSAADGSVRWRRHLMRDFGGRSGTWAYAESPLVDGDRLIVTPGGRRAALVALDKHTGEEIWRAAVPGGDEAGYASAIIVEAAGYRQYVQFMGNGLVGVEAETGRFLWRYDGTGGGPGNIMTPVAHDNLVYSGANRVGGAAVRLTADGDSVNAAELYRRPDLPTTPGGLVRVGDYLYGTTSRAMICAEFASGRVVWQDAAVGAASVCYADGRLYVHGDDGRVALVEATPEAYRERGRFTPPEAPDLGRTRAWPYPVVANGRLYLRQLGTIWCYDVSASQVN